MMKNSESEPSLMEVDAVPANQTDDTNKDVNKKRVAREYENLIRPLQRNTSSLPPQGTVDELKQVFAWKRYISWEKHNHFKNDDRVVVIKRVMQAYEQALSILPHYPDMWFEAANYLIQEGKAFAKANNQEETKKLQTEVEQLFEKAIATSMKDSPLIYFAYADFEESLSNFDKCEEIYKKCLENQQINATLVYITYMRFVRRTRGIKAAREVFKLGREDKRTTYHLYVAASEMEYLCNKETGKAVGLKIFQLRAKEFANSNDFMLAYIKYMDHLNEDNNKRVLFERILTSEELPKEGVSEIWSKFLDFECYCGDLSSVLKVDKKRQKALESAPDYDKSKNTLIIDRYKFLDLLPCNSAELKSMGYVDLKQDTPSFSAATVNAANQPAAAKLLLNAMNKMSKASAHKFKSNYPCPDEMQMLPFKPVRNALPGLHSVPGGIFPFPLTVTELVKKLPPPNMFQGPFVMIDEFMRRFAVAEITEDYQPSYIYVNGEPMKDMDQISYQQQQHANAAKRSMQMNNDSDDEDMSKKSKGMDIFKQRQHKKLSKN